jgi:hypothetical protein
MTVENALYGSRRTETARLPPVADEVGEEFDGMEAAQGHAMTVAKELSRGRLPRALIGRHISVVDERGVVVLKVPL